MPKTVFDAWPPPSSSVVSSALFSVLPSAGFDPHAVSTRARLSINTVIDFAFLFLIVASFYL